MRMNVVVWWRDIVTRDLHSVGASGRHNLGVIAILALLCEWSGGVTKDIELSGEETFKSTAGGVGICG